MDVFSTTPEPAGAAQSREGIAAVVRVLPPLQTKLHHHHRHDHLAVRGEDLIAEEKTKFAFVIFVIFVFVS